MKKLSLVAFCLLFAGSVFSQQDWGKISNENRKESPFGRRELGTMTDAIPDMVPKRYANYPRIQVDATQAEANGLRVLEGEKVVIVTDLKITPEIEKLPQAVADALPQMASFFGVTPPSDWKLTAFLMKDNIPFTQAGYLPDILPPFQNGFSFNYDCWLYEQPSGYYRRHLLLHEMVHSFANTTLGNVGPGWYAEGTAEYLAAHDSTAAPLALGFMPPNKKATPYFARVKELRDACHRGEARTFEEARQFGREDYGTNAIYYWSWAMVRFLVNHPDTADAFRSLPEFLKTNPTPDAFDEHFQKLVADKISTLRKHWLMYVATFDYGYALEPMLFDTTPGKPLSAKVIQDVAVDRGWQNMGIALRQGDKIRIRAIGKYELYKKETLSYPCEPNGITLEYHRGSPLGILQAVILPDEEVTREMMNDASDGTFFKPLEIGLNRTFEVPRDGTLYLGVNVPTVHMSENRGRLKVEIKRIEDL
ncbi:MAG: hypothetical protein Q4D98_03230 [Planctomycetia bacterium]|nr:hypothetical protein [Planctomycetia bacterium]